LFLIEYACLPYIVNLIRAKSICSQTQFSHIINRLLTSLVRSVLWNIRPLFFCMDLAPSSLGPYQKTSVWYFTVQTSHSVNKPLLLSIDFKSLFNARFPSSLQTCQLRFQVQKLGVNFATKFASTSQCLNYCKEMFIVKVENLKLTIQWKVLVFHWIGYYWVWTFVYKRSSNIEINLRTLLRSSPPISELGNVIGKFATNLGTARCKVTWNRQ
jgi:hypothetical protein